MYVSGCLLGPVTSAALLTATVKRCLCFCCTRCDLHRGSGVPVRHNESSRMKKTIYMKPTELSDLRFPSTGLTYLGKLSLGTLTLSMR